MQNNNNNLILGGLVVVAILGLVYYFNLPNNTEIKDANLLEVKQNILNQENTKDQNLAQENLAENLTTNTTVGKIIGGYPSSWPSDIPKYPNGTILEKAGNNPKSAPTEAIVVFTTKDSVKTVVTFYLNSLISSGWKITEDGSGTGNMTTFRATKGKRSFSGYAVYENGKTEVTLGVNQGM